MGPPEGEVMQSSRSHRAKVISTIVALLVMAVAGVLAKMANRSPPDSNSTSEIEAVNARRRNLRSIDGRNLSPHSIINANARANNPAIYEAKVTESPNSLREESIAIDTPNSTEPLEMSNPDVRFLTQNMKVPDAQLIPSYHLLQKTRQRKLSELTLGDASLSDPSDRETSDANSEILELTKYNLGKDFADAAKVIGEENTAEWERYLETSLGD